jgi:hypothetical protein
MVACDYDQALEPTVGDNCENVIVSYENGVEELIERTCAYDGCHVTGFSSGDYTSYESIIPFLEDIENRTLRVQDMPPDYSPDGKAKSLTADEIQLLSCWIADGAPEQ